MVDYELKSKVISNGLYNQFKEVHKSMYLNFILTTYGVDYNNSCMSIDVANDIYYHLSTNNYDEWHECEKIYNADYKRTARLKRKISDMLLNNNCIFLTLTFTDRVLSNTSDATRRRYVTRVLKDMSSDYVANIDFGLKNGREHYHAIVVSNSVDHSIWKYGNLDFRRCCCGDNDIIRMSKYINKLTNHAIKKTTKRNAIIYSR